MFSPGQEIVAIRNHPNGVFKKGEIFMIRDVQPGVCKCHDFLIDIGYPFTGNTIQCVCGIYHNVIYSSWWFSNRHFALIDSIEGEAVLEEFGELVEILK